MLEKSQDSSVLVRTRQNRLTTYIALVLIAGTGALGFSVYKSIFIKPSSVIESNSINNISLIKEIPQPRETFEDFGITLDAPRVSAPIIPDVDGSDSAIYYGALEKGVAQYKGSSTPDNNGNLFVFGHSSFFKDKPGDYKQIFKELNQAQPGDEFVIHYKKIPYRYRVTKSYETTNVDWALIDPTPEIDDDKTVTIMTCWPPGKTLKRWGVVATQI